MFHQIKCVAHSDHPLFDGVFYPYHRNKAARVFSVKCKLYFQRCRDSDDGFPVVAIKIFPPSLFIIKIFEQKRTKGKKCVYVSGH